MFCKFCGKQIGENAKFCRFCGQSLVTEGEAEKIYCSDCGSQIGKDSAFCSVCGHAVELNVAEEHMAFCENCGGRIDERARFCMHCAQRIEPEAQESATVPEPIIAPTVTPVTPTPKAESDENAALIIFPDEEEETAPSRSESYNLTYTHRDTSGRMSPISISGNDSKQKCIQCGSSNVRVDTTTLTNTTTSGGGFSAAKGCLGYLLLGPLGILCGACGQKQTTQTTNTVQTTWVCQDCGRRFRRAEDLVKELSGLEEQQRVMPIVMGVSAALLILLGIILANVLEDAAGAGVLFIILGVLGVASIFLLRNKMQGEIEALENELMKVRSAQKK